jgi:hypothetical protein
LLFEFHTDILHWESLLYVVQAVFNFSPTTGNGGLSPLFAFIGVEPPNPVHAFLELESVWSGAPLCLEDYAKDVNDLVDLFREREVWIHNEQEQAIFQRQAERVRRGGVQVPDFPIGSFVMAHNYKRRTKHEPRWTGPWRVISNTHDDHVVGVEGIVAMPNGDFPLETYHVKYVKFFDYPGFIVTPELRAAHSYFSNRMWDVEALINMRKVDDQFQMRVLWEDGEKTWELVAELLSSVPQLVEAFLEDGFPVSIKKVRDLYLNTVRTGGGITARKRKGKRG